jgi:hypothetical protein
MEGVGLPLHSIRRASPIPKAAETGFDGAIKEKGEVRLGKIAHAQNPTSHE